MQKDTQPIEDEALAAKIGSLLDNFYHRRISNLQKLELKKKLAAKNPYLVHAVGMTSSDEIVTELLNAHISSSDETLFGNEFFEPLAKWVAEAAHKGQAGVTVQVSGAEGCDILLSAPDRDEAIAVKSGTKVFNAQSRGKQQLEFQKIERILKKNKRMFVALVGYCYGRKEQRESALGFKELAGQAFWKHLSGYSDFYERIINGMRSKPAEHRAIFLEEYQKAKNRFSKVFLEEYCLPDGTINWARVARLSSEQKMTVEDPLRTQSENRPTSKNDDPTPSPT